MLEPGMNSGSAISAGNFILNAYDAYHSDETNLRPEVNLPPGHDLVAYVTMEDFVFKPGNPKERRFYGFLAHETSTDHYVIAIRGTEGLREWWDNFHVLMVPFREASNGGRVAYGFKAIYGTLDITYVDDAVLLMHASSFADEHTVMAKPASERVAAVTAGMSFADKVGVMVRVHQAHHHNSKPDHGADILAGDVSISATDITITGHSLGGALATLFVLENDSKEKAKIAPREVFTFASPRVGDANFAASYNALQIDSWRIYNAPDFVPMVPFGVEGFVHVDHPYGVDTRTLDDVKWTPTCWHDMNSYLHALGKPFPPESACHIRSMPQWEADLLGGAGHLARRALGLRCPEPVQAS